MISMGSRHNLRLHAMLRCVWTTTAESNRFFPWVNKSAWLGGAKRLIHYELPDHLIARHQVNPRDSSRLLVVLPSDSVPTTLRRGTSAILNHIESCKSVSSEEQGFIGARHTRVQWHRGTHSPDVDWIRDYQFRDLPSLLPHGAHLVVNESKVLPARMFAKIVDAGDDEIVDVGNGTNAIKDHTEAIEVLFLCPTAADATAVDYQQLMNTPANGQVWRCMVRSDVCKTTTRLEVVLNQTKNAVHLVVEQVHQPWIEEGEADGAEVDVRIESVSANVDMSGEALFAQLGDIPLPPYMQRAATESDGINYQTVFARESGSVAAPTAGLHFSDDTMKELALMNVTSSKVCLHVGAGTFKPVSGGDINTHAMHQEQWEVSRREMTSLLEAMASHSPIVSVGTTSTRVIESLYWIGAKRLLLLTQRDSVGSTHAVDVNPTLRKWEALNIATQYTSAGLTLPTATQALKQILLMMNKGTRARTRTRTKSVDRHNDSTGRNDHDGGDHDRDDHAGGDHGDAQDDGDHDDDCDTARTMDDVVRGTTSACIAPGYTFQVIDALVTNFHQSDSTLMYLVSALLNNSNPDHQHNNNNNNNNNNNTNNNNNNNNNIHNNTNNNTNSSNNNTTTEITDDAALVGTNRLLTAYSHAIDKKYRFLSYGDACLLLNHQPAAQQQQQQQHQQHK